MSIRNTSILTVALVGALLLGAFPAGAANIDTGRGYVLSTASADPLNAVSQIRTDLSTTDCGQIVGGRGASFQYPLWQSALPFYNAEGCNQAAYWSCGSGCGKAGTLATTTSDVAVDTGRVADLFAGSAAAGPVAGKSWTLFGGSDAPLTAADYGRANLNGPGAEILHIPITLGGVTLAYNLASCSDGELQLTGAEIGRMYRPLDANGITHWDDASLRTNGRNACLANEHTPVVRVIRSDSSGTSFVFSDFLARTAGSPWVATQSFGSIAQSTLPAPGNSGVAANVTANYGAIGYVELAQALTSGLKVAKVQNAAGNYVYPTPESFVAASDGARPTLPAAQGNWTGISIANAPGANSYPASSYSYVIFYANPFVAHRSASDNVAFTARWNANQYAATVDLLSWMLTEGQSHFPTGFAPLGGVAQIGLDGLKRAQYGPEATFTVGPSLGKTTLEQGAPCAGSVVTMVGGLFTETQACESYEGNVVILGGVVVTDGVQVGKVRPLAGVQDGIYTSVQGSSFNGIFYADAAQ